MTDLKLSIAVDGDDAPPAMVMCPPLYLDNKVPNNVWMKKGEKVDRDRALRQYRRIKRALEALGRRVLEIPPKKGLQDQMFTANIAVAIKPYIVLANYKAPGRPGEEPVARKFFEGLGYEVIQPPYHFEGEADLKQLEDGLFLGGFGQFTDPRALDWISERCGVEVVKLRETNPQLYHLDTCLMVLDPGHAWVTPNSLDKASLKELAEYIDFDFTPKGIESTGVTNGIKIPEKGVYMTGTLVPEDKNYRKAMDWLQEMCDKMGWVTWPLDTDSVDVSGADLSCTVCHVTFAPDEP